jgi:hypothetical protein
MLTRKDVERAWQETFDADDWTHIVAFANAAVTIAKAATGPEPLSLWRRRLIEHVIIHLKMPASQAVTYAQTIVERISNIEQLEKQRHREQLREIAVRYNSDRPDWFEKALIEAFTLGNPTLSMLESEYGSKALEG